MHTGIQHVGHGNMPNDEQLLFNMLLHLRVIQQPCVKHLQEFAGAQQDAAKAGKAANAKRKEASPAAPATL